MQYEGSPVEESRPVGEVKGCDCHIAKKLNSQISGLNVHVRPNASSLSYLLKNYFEGLLKFGATVCALGKGARIEDGRVIVKCQTKALPIQVIGGLHELLQCLLHPRFRRCGFLTTDPSRPHKPKQSGHGNRFHHVRKP